MELHKNRSLVYSLLACAVVAAAVWAYIFVVLRPAAEQAIPEVATRASVANPLLEKYGIAFAKDAVLPETFSCGWEDRPLLVPISILCRTFPATITSSSTAYTHLSLGMRTDAVSDSTERIAGEVVAKLPSGVQTEGAKYACAADIPVTKLLRGVERNCTLTLKDSTRYFFSILFFDTSAVPDGRFMLYSYNPSITEEADHRAIVKTAFDNAVNSLQTVQPRISWLNSVAETAHAQAGGDGGSTGDPGSPTSPGDSGPHKYYCGYEGTIVWPEGGGCSQYVRTSGEAVYSVSVTSANLDNHHTGQATFSCLAPAIEDPRANGAEGIWHLDDGWTCVPDPCSRPWGGDPIKSGDSITAYRDAVSSSCAYETRTCNAGTLSGTYTNQSCNPPTITTPAPTVTLDEFSPSTITVGGSSSISFRSTNATSCTGGGLWNGDLGGTSATNRSTGAMNSAGTFYQVVTCTGPGGSTTSATRSLTVQAASPGPSCTLTASPATIQKDATASTLSWTTTRARSFSISPNVGSIPSGEMASGSRSGIGPQSTQTYTGTVTAANGSTATCSATVTVNTTVPSGCGSGTLNDQCGPGPSCTITATPSSITAGQSARLTVTSRNMSAFFSSPSAFYFSTYGGPAPATYSESVTVSPAQTTKYTIQGSNDVNPGFAYCDTTITVTAPGAADLVASGIDRSSITVNTSGIFSGNITNSGSASTGGSFNNFIQVATAANGGGTVTDLASSNMGTLAAGGTRTHSQNYTFTSTGTYSMRLCADKSNRSSAGSIAESDEGNNCGAWTTISVTAVGAVPPSCMLASDPASVRPGQTATLYWTTTDATSFDVDQGIGSLTPVARGTHTVSLDTSKTYGGTVTGPGGIRYCSVHVSYGNLPSGCGQGTRNDECPSTCSLTASPTSIQSGESSTLSWYTTSASSFSINQGVGPVTPASLGSTVVSPNTTTTYTGTSIGGNGMSSTCSVTVTATVPALPDLTAGAVSPTSATAGTAATFSATITNGGSVATGGSFNNFMQVATAANGGGTVTDLASSNTGNLAAGGTRTHSTSYTFPTAGTYSMRMCADKSNRDSAGSVTELSETNNCGAWTTILVIGICANGATDYPTCTPAAPDLTVSDTRPTTAAVYEPTNFSATVSNVGGSSTGRSFSTFLQVATAVDGGGTITDLASSNMGALAAGESNGFTTAYTFPATGTYSMRACADKADRNSTGVITESNEGNNCGRWTSVAVTGCANGATNPPSCSPSPTCPDPTRSYPNCGRGSSCPNGEPNYPVCGGDPVCNDPTATNYGGIGSCVYGPPPPPPPRPQTATANLTAAPSTIDEGDSSQLVWSSSHATSCTSAGGFSTGGATSGRVDVSPTVTSIYSVTCSGPGGTSAPANATVTVTGPTVSITASPTRVRQGGTTTVSWNASHVQSCAITRNGISWRSGMRGTGTNKTVSGSASDAVTSQITYVMTCGSTSATVVVNVAPDFQEF